MKNTEIAYQQFFSNLSVEQIEMLKHAEKLYIDWNHKINVISRKEHHLIRERHFLHSLLISKVQTFSASDFVIDVGTGGGFPGLPLAIMFPDTSFLLVDSIQKKLKVVQDIAHQLGLENILIKCERIENIEARPTYLVSRAVKRLSVFLPWVDKLMNHKNFQALLYLKGGDLSEEKQEVNAYSFKEFPLNTFCSGPFFETKKVLSVRKQK